MPDRPFIIAIDGPAASGKGTLARRLAQTLGLRHLDTGLGYRAVARAMLAAAIPLDDEERAAAVAEGVDLSQLDAGELAAHEIGEAASRIAVMSAVRRILARKQREFGSRGPGAVLDGRDIGTVIFPDADVKLFLTADPATRAKRRADEIRAKGGECDQGAIARDLEERDRRDYARADSPLRPAKDAHLIDTTAMDIETAFQAALTIVEAVRRRAEEI